MQAVRGFAAYLQTTDPDAEIPPAGLLPGGPRRAVPYLYSPADIAALLEQASKLKTPLRQETIKTLIGLMAVTGMRGGEVVALDDEDFDAERGLLRVRHAKLGRHRLLPLHATTVTALLAYRQLRDQRFPGRAARHCWYPARAPGCCITMSARRSPGWPARPDWLRAREPAPAAA